MLLNLRPLYASIGLYELNASVLCIQRRPNYQLLTYMALSQVRMIFFSELTLIKSENAVNFNYDLLLDILIAG